MTGRKLHRLFVDEWHGPGAAEDAWEGLSSERRQVWETVAEAMIDRAELVGAFDRIGGLPDRNTESPESFSERVEAGDAQRIAFDVALILTQDA